MLAIITVIYNNYEILGDFFSSLASQKAPNFAIFIADCSSQQQLIDTSSMTKLGVSVDVTLCANNGYAHGVNVCLDRANGMNYQNFCIVNPDISFEKEFVEKAVASIQAHPESILSGKIYYYPGFEYHKDTYKPEDIGHVVWYAGGKIDWDHALASHRGVDEVDTGQYQTLEETDFATGCLVAYDKAVADKLAEWDEGYFMYFEDVDFCVQAKKKKIKIYYDPEIVIWHKNAQSTDGSGSELHRRTMAKSRLRFGLKYAPLQTKLHLLKNHFLRKL